jgi:hypothetical protein
VVPIPPDQRPASPALCPECGKPPAGVSTRSLFARLIVPRLPLVLALLPLLAVGIWFALSYISSTNSNGQYVPYPVAGLLTRADLQRIADGETPGDSFAQSVLRNVRAQDTQPHDAAIVFGFDTVGTIRSNRGWRIGWPGQLYSRWITHPADAPPPADDPVVGTPKVFWRDEFRSSSWTCQSGTLGASSFYANAIPVLAALGVLSYLIARSLANLIASRTNAKPARARLIRLTLAALFLGALLGAQALSFQRINAPRVSSYRGQSAPDVKSFAGHTRRQLSDLLNKPEAGAQLARTILERVPAPADPDAVLFLNSIEGYTFKGTFVTALHRTLQLAWNTYSPNPAYAAATSTQPRPMTTTLRARFENANYLTLRAAVAGAQPRALLLTLNIGRLALLFLAIVLFAYLGRLLRRTLDRRRARRTGIYCAHCGYEVGHPPVPTAP